MNFKRMVKTSILNCLFWIPDRQMVKIQYRLKTGRKLNLKKPKRFTEKLQWYKLYYRNTEMSKCADKYTVREYVTSKGYPDILIELYGVYNTIEDIDFDKLPNQFVLKSSNGGGGNEVFIHEENKRISQREINNLKKRTKNWTRIKNKDIGREWVYCVEKPKLLVEKYLNDEGDLGLVDYKFLCFNGIICAVYYIYQRKAGQRVKLIICDENLTPLPYSRCDELPGTVLPVKPHNYERMKEIARILSQEFPHVRVDLYNVKGKVYFSELTFFDGSGYMKYEPDEYDYILGSYFNLP